MHVQTLGGRTLWIRRDHSASGHVMDTIDRPRVFAMHAAAVARESDQISQAKAPLPTVTARLRIRQPAQQRHRVPNIRQPLRLIFDLPLHVHRPPVTRPLHHLDEALHPHRPLA